MSAAVTNWLIELGSTQSQIWALKTAGVAVNLANWHARLQIRSTPESSVLIFSADDTTIGNLEIDATLGTVTCPLPVATDDLLAMLETLPDGKEPVPDATKTTVVTACGKIAYYGLDMIDPDGTVIPTIKAKVVFAPWIVKPS